MRRVAGTATRASILLAPLLAALCMGAARGEVQPSTPPEEPDPARARVEAFLARASKLIADRNYDSETTAHYRVKTDDPRLDTKATAGLLESFWSFFDEFWKGRADLRPGGDPAQIFLFYSRYKYKQLLDEAERAGEDLPVGHYREFYDVVAIHTDTVGLEDLPDVLVHEAAHQLVQRRLYGDRGRPASWVTEGLANYFGFMLRDRKGLFHPGANGGKGVKLFEEINYGKGAAAWAELGKYRSSIRKETARPLAETLKADPPAFYGEEKQEHYAAAWVLVHFLLHSDGGSRGAAFARFIARDAAGEGTPENLCREIGVTLQELEAAFREYALDARFR